MKKESRTRRVVVRFAPEEYARQRALARLGEMLDQRLEEIRVLTIERDRLRHAAEQAREALTPTENALEMFEAIAADFIKETGLWPPGKDCSAAYGRVDENPERTLEAWRDYKRAWWPKKVAISLFALNEALAHTEPGTP